MREVGTSDPNAPVMGRRGVLLLAAATLFGFGGAGLALILWGQDREVPWSQGMAVFPQVLVGIVAGTAIATLAAWIIDQPYMKAIKAKYVELIGPLFVRRSDIWIVSLCAGAGEEIFFRGALQHWLGIPLTALVFVAIHGYLDPRNWRICIYGAALTAGMMLIGWMASQWGLVAPIAAHAVIDIVLLRKLARAFSREAQSVG